VRDSAFSVSTTHHLEFEVEQHARRAWFNEQMHESRSSITHPYDPAFSRR
jgi:hypothetical protein